MTHDFDESDDDEESGVRTVRKLMRNGSVLKYREISYDIATGDAVDYKLLWAFDLMVFIQIPFILLIIAIWVLAMHERYQECMELFNKFFFCAVR